MDLPAENKHSPSLVIGRFLMSFVIGFLVGMILTYILQVTGVTDKKILIALSHLAIFVFPGLIFGFWHFGRDIWSKVTLMVSPEIRILLLGILLLFVGAFFTQYIYGVNKLIPLPEWMIEDEAAKEALILELLAMNNWVDLVISVLVMACLPAFGEELIFRGILQKYLVLWTKNAWIGIIISAAIFSAIHMQFQGFLPRMYLGILLGYAFWVSGSLWLPILLHFINNAAQVVMYYLYEHGLSSIDIMDGVEVSWLYGMGSLLITIIIMWVMYSIRPRPLSEVREI